MTEQCTHLNQIRVTSTETHVCEDCIKTGDRWVHLRLCLSCGHVGCCETLQINEAPTGSIDRAGRKLGLVLPGSARSDDCGTDADVAMTADCPLPASSQPAI